MQEGAATTDLATAARSRLPILVSAATGVVSFAVYAATASRTITWWDGSSYPLAACTLGITAAPGSVLLTLLGWVVSRIPLIHPVAFRLNLFAALIAAVLVGLVTWLATRLAAPTGRGPGAIEAAAGAIAGLTLAFSVTVWTYAVQFTPYILSACFTALILVAAMDWWRRAAASDQPARLFLLFLLFGLDFSVHRTNELLLPAALVWIALRRPRAWLRPLNWGAAGGALLLGLSLQLALIPLAARDPAFDMGEPRNLARLWSYVSMEQQGGGFLIRLLPRAADLVHVQLADYVEFLRRNLLASGPGLFRLVPVLLAILGWMVALWNDARRSIGLAVFFLLASLGAVLYFNLPAHYFRSIDRHYLPSLVIAVPWVGVGAGAVLRLTSRLRGIARAGLALVLGALLLVAPLASWSANRRACDLSRTRFAEDYSRDVLEPLPKDAILLTNGDNDTFPLWYLQQVERVRPDVLVVNVSATNAGWYVAQLRRHHPDFSRLLEGTPGTGVPNGRAAADTTVTVPVDAGARLDWPSSSAPPRSVRFRLTGEILPQDLVLMDLLRLNRWRRPVYLAVTVARQQLPWLWPCARLDGMAWCTVPTADPGVWDLERLRRKLTETVRYAGVADTTIVMDSDTRRMCSSYAAALLMLAGAQLERGDPQACLATLRFLDEHAPETRFRLMGYSVQDLRAQAESRLRGRTSPRRSGH